MPALTIIAMTSCLIGCVGTKETSVAAAINDARAICGDPPAEWDAGFQDALADQLAATDRASPLWEVFRQAEAMRTQIDICIEG